MSHNRFVWTDLSTFEVGEAKNDYSALFGWRFDRRKGYSFAHAEETQVSAVFAMPEKLAHLNLPSFWMSYIRVEDLDAAITKATKHPKVVIEIKPERFGTDARIALVRDPSGAGVTLYEGPDLLPPQGKRSEKTVFARHLHLRSINEVEGFYRDLFDWHFEPVQNRLWKSFHIVNAQRELIAQAEEVPETIRGRFSYWMPCFAIDSIEEASKQLKRLNGRILSDLGDGRWIAHDRQGASFMVREVGSCTAPGETAPSAAENKGSSSIKKFPLLSLFGLGCIWAAVAFEFQLFWGLLFLIWTWPILRSGRADFLDRVERDKHPVVYWGIVTTWVSLSLWMIVEALSS